MLSKNHFSKNAGVFFMLFESSVLARTLNRRKSKILSKKTGMNAGGFCPRPLSLNLVLLWSFFFFFAMTKFTILFKP